MTNEDLQPDVQEVLQSEEYEPVSVNVCVEKIKTPVRTQSLPRKQGGTKTLSVGTSVVKLVPADHNRADIVVTSFDEDIYVAFNAQAAEDSSTMQRWPALVPYPIDITSAIYVKALQNTTTVSFGTKLWAVGD